MNKALSASNRVIFNTGVQYIRTLISVCITLYSSRIILRELGASDYGIFNLVAGVIAMLAFINISLSSTTQRYLSYHQGKKDMQMQVKIFNNSIFIQLFLGLLLTVVLYLLSPLIFNDFLNIPPDRLNAATFVYNCMILSVFFSMLTTPYMATVIAHENILFSSSVQLIETILKLGIAVSLIYISKDKLTYYSTMVVAIAVVSFILYMIYCRKKYEECRKLSFQSFDKHIFKEMFSFTGWTIYSTACVVGRTQGIAVVLNRFFGTIINAAYGIGLQIAGQINIISGSMLNAINPQIVKAEGEQNRKKMLRLSEIASKFSFFLLAMIVIPAVFEMKPLLSLWLGNYPEYTVLFSRGIIIMSLVDQLTVGLIHANRAIGNIKYYSLTINTIKILTVPAAFICLYIGLSPVWVVGCMIFFEFVCCISRLFFLKKTGGLSIKGFISNVFAYEIIPIVATIAICWVSHLFLPHYLFLLSFLFAIFVLGITAYFFGLCKDEKEIIAKLVSKVLNTIKNR